MANPPEILLVNWANAFNLIIGLVTLVDLSTHCKKLVEGCLPHGQKWNLLPNQGFNEEDSRKDLLKVKHFFTWTIKQVYSAIMLSWIVRCH